jgi:hypothetical protein
MTPKLTTLKKEARAKKLRKQRRREKLRDRMDADGSAQAAFEVAPAREGQRPDGETADWEIWVPSPGPGSPSPLDAGAAGEDAEDFAEDFLLASVGDDDKDQTVGDDVNHQLVGDDSKHQPVGDDVKNRSVGDDAKHRAVGDDVKHRAVGDDVKNPPVSPTVITLSDDSDEDSVRPGPAAELRSPAASLTRHSPPQNPLVPLGVSGALLLNKGVQNSTPPLLAQSQPLPMQAAANAARAAQNNSLDQANAMIKELRARLAVETQVLGTTLQREALAIKKKEEERQQEQRVSPSLYLLTYPEYAQRFEILVKSGWAMPETHAALQTTALDGKYSVQRAQAHLLAEQNADMRRALDSSAEAVAEHEDAPKRILETSALARVLRERPDAVDIIVKLRDYHARSKARAAHSALPALCAANLVQAAAIKNDLTTTRFGYAYLCKVAQAVSEDCEDCKKLCSKREQEEAWKATAAQAAVAKQDKANAAKLAREQALSRTKDQQEGFMPDLPFKLSDSRQDVTRAHGECEGCGLGFTGPKDTRWLLFCVSCNKGYHVHCTTWTLYRRRDGSELNACRLCFDANELAYANGESTDSWKVLSTNHKGVAPNHSAASDTPAKPANLHNELSTIGRTSATPPQTPTKLGPPDRGSGCPSGGSAATMSERQRASYNADRNSPNFSEPDSGSKLLSSIGDSAGQRHRQNDRNSPNLFEPDSSSKLPSSNLGVSTGQKRPPNVKVKDYTKWEAVPDDWVKKRDAKSDEHPERGYGKEAYKNWRKKNVALRDAAMEDTSYGLLARALSDEMKVSIGNQFLSSENHMPGLWERETFLTQKAKDLWVDAWIENHDDFTWVHQVDDETLLKVLDKHFGVKSTSVFLSRRFPANLPLTNEKGEVNYYETEFNRWATSWHADLIELKKSDCDFSGTNLYQALLNALSTNKTIWNEASQNASRSPYVLIAYLRDWLRRKSLAAQETREERDALLSQQNETRTLSNQTKGKPAIADQEDSTTRAFALFTQTMSAYAQQMAGGAAVQSTDEAKPNKPLPKHIKACKDAAKCKCSGCGNVWARSRPIPCFYACKYTEHPAYNGECDTNSFPNKDPLTWKDFALKYPNTTPPPNCVTWEKNNEAYLAKKRAGRDETTTSTKR